VKEKDKEDVIFEKKAPQNFCESGLALEPVDDLAAPALLGLPLQDVAADAPVEAMSSLLTARAARSRVSRIRVFRPASQAG